MIPSITLHHEEIPKRNKKREKPKEPSFVVPTHFPIHHHHL